MPRSKREPNHMKGLEELRKELKSHARSFKSDMKNEWRRIENDWHLLQRQMLPAKKAAEKSAAELKAASDLLVKSVQRGYTRIKNSLSS
jgi:hypothetical protein